MITRASSYDDGQAYHQVLNRTNDYIYIELPDGQIIRITGDGSIHINGVPQTLTELAEPTNPADLSLGPIG